MVDIPTQSAPDRMWRAGAAGRRAYRVKEAAHARTQSNAVLNAQPYKPVRNAKAVPTINPARRDARSETQASRPRAPSFFFFFFVFFFAGGCKQTSTVTTSRERAAAARNSGLTERMQSARPLP